MYVCICNEITDKQIRSAARAGAKDLWDLQRELGVATNCGSCKQTATRILRETERTMEPKRYQPAVA
jgi:bacterioferritin-associated ferredoxin